MLYFICKIDTICLSYSSWVYVISVFSYRPKKSPLFLVDLVLDQTGAHYSTPLDSFESSIITLFDNGILSTYNVPQLDKVRWALRLNLLYIAV